MRSRVREKQPEAVTPREVLDRLLRAAGDDLALVGGQALAFWVHRYGLALPGDVVAVSADTDFLALSAADRAAVSRMAAALQGTTQFPNRRALTALVGQAYLDINDDEFINGDVVFRVIGLSQEAIRKRAVRVAFDDEQWRRRHDRPSSPEKRTPFVITMRETQSEPLVTKIAEIKDDRLQVRLDTVSKGVLQRAASYRRKTVSQFVLASALEEAERVIRENEVVSLSSADWTIFFDALTNPPAPNAALRTAFAKYQKATR